MSATPTPEITLVVAGQALIKKDPRLSWDDPFGSLRPVLDAADVAFLACLLVEEIGIAPTTSGEAMAQTLSQRGAERSRQDYRWRADANSMSRMNVANGVPGLEFTTCIGPLAPVWEKIGRAHV